MRLCAVEFCLDYLFFLRCFVVVGICVLNVVLTGIVA